MAIKHIVTLGFGPGDSSVGFIATFGFVAGAAVDDDDEDEEVYTGEEGCYYDFTLPDTATWPEGVSKYS